MTATATKKSPVPATGIADNRWALVSIAALARRDLPMGMPNGVNGLLQLTLCCPEDVGENPLAVAQIAGHHLETLRGIRDVFIAEAGPYAKWREMEHDLEAARTQLRAARAESAARLNAYHDALAGCGDAAAAKAARAEANEREGDSLNKVTALEKALPVAQREAERALSQRLHQERSTIRAAELAKLDQQLAALREFVRDILAPMQVTVETLRMLCPHEFNVPREAMSAIGAPNLGMPVRDPVHEMLPQELRERHL